MAQIERCSRAAQAGDNLLSSILAWPAPGQSQRFVPKHLFHIIYSSLLTFQQKTYKSLWIELLVTLCAPHQSIPTTNVASFVNFDAAS